jgi:hypothetical protein
MKERLVVGATFNGKTEHPHSHVWWWENMIGFDPTGASRRAGGWDSHMTSRVLPSWIGRL